MLTYADVWRRCSTGLDPKNRHQLEALYLLLIQRLQSLSPESAGAGGRGGGCHDLDHDSIEAASWGLYQLTHLMPALAKSEWLLFLARLQVRD